MGTETGIEWTDATWNPIRGCTRVSEGCRNCYAERVAARFSGGGQPFHGFAKGRGTASKWTGRVELVPAMLAEPLRWRRPRRIFVNSMSDLFHEALPDRDIATVYGHAIAAARVRGHTLQILTKRAKRMRDLLTTHDFWMEACGLAQDLVRLHGKTGATDNLPMFGPGNPPPGIQLGVSAENQAAADERVPHLLACPAAVRFVSAEPLLGPLDLRRVAPGHWGEGSAIDALAGGIVWADGGSARSDPRQHIGWVIAGGESGHGARPAHPDWFRSLRDQCHAAGVPFFFKQWGAWETFYDRDQDDPDWRRCPGTKDGQRYLNLAGGHGFHGDRVVAVRRRTKARTGAELDGREWRQVPQP